MNYITCAHPLHFLMLSFNQNSLGYLGEIFYFNSESTYHGYKLTVGKYTPGIYILSLETQEEHV